MLDASKVKTVKVRTQHQIADVGTYPARVVAVVDVGVHPQNPFKGKEKPPARMIRVTYEFLDEFLKDDEGNDIPDKPRWLTEEFPLLPLAAERATSTRRYLALDPLQTHKGNWGKLLGTPCMISVVHNKSKTDGIIWENISEVSSMRPKEAAKAPELINEPYLFDMDDFNKGSWDRIPDWLKNKIKEAENFVNSSTYLALELDDDIPFEHTPPKATNKAAKMAQPVEEEDEEEEEESW